MGALEDFGAAVDDGDFVREMQHRLWAEMLGRPTRAPTFPGAQPVSFARQHVRALHDEDYYVCEKSDGLRFLLYLSAPWGAPAAFLIDRNYAVRAVPGLVLPGRDGAPQTETLVDGELVLEDGRPVFLIFDALLVGGRNVMGHDLNGRLKAVQNEVVGPAADVCDPMALRLKKMWKPYAIAEILEREIPAQKHGNDGLIFTPVADPYAAGTCPRLLKWKPAEMNTVDFLVHVNAGAPLAGERIELHVAGDGGRPRFFAFHAPSADVEALDGRVVECRYTPEGWSFVRERRDKRTGNHERVARAIVDSIADNVTAAELVSAIPAIRRAWKAREAGVST